MITRIKRFDKIKNYSYIEQGNYINKYGLEKRTMKNQNNTYEKLKIQNTKLSKVNIGKFVSLCFLCPY